MRVEGERNMKKKWLLGFVLLLALALVACSENTDTSKKALEGGKSTEGVVVKIGVQGSGGIYGKAREEKWFEDALAEYGAKVEWTEFTSGPPMTEAMASDKLDFASLGNMPVIAAQSANIPFKIISVVIDGKKNVGVIAKNGFETLEDLKGKKIAVGTGTNAYGFLYRALEQDGIDPAEIELINLAPDEAQAAYDSGSVDAWAIWEPYLSINALSQKGNIIADGTTHNILSPSFQIVREGFAKDYPELVVAFLKVQDKMLQWEKENQQEAFDRYAIERALPAELFKAINERAKQISVPVSNEIIEEHQKSADLQYELGTIRTKIDIKKVVDNQYIEKAQK